jgi:hypothetical protein
MMPLSLYICSVFVKEIEKKLNQPTFVEERKLFNQKSIKPQEIEIFFFFFKPIRKPIRNQ